MGCAPSAQEQTPVPKVDDSFELEIGDIEVTQQAVEEGGASASAGAAEEVGSVANIHS